MQAAFRGYCGTTPTGYLRRLRPEGVHRDMQVADPAAGTPVTDIAAA